MNILILSHACVTAANQQFYSEVERQTNWKLTIVVPSNWKNQYSSNIKPERWSDYIGRLVSIPVWKPGNIPLHTYQSIFTSLLRETQPDVIYINHEPYAVATTQIYIANQLTGNKPIGFFTWQNILKRYPFPFRQMESFVFQRSNFAFLGSESAEDILKIKGYRNRSVILPGSVDPSIYHPYEKAHELGARLRSEPNEILIGFVGRLVEEKGLKTLLKALEKIRNLSWKLIVVGSGECEQEFDLLVENFQLSSKVKRLGYIPHTESPQYLSAFDLLVLPSETRLNWKEQFGRVIIEALACGTPVLGSDSGEIPYLLRDTGGGIIFPEGDSVKFAEALRKLISSSSSRKDLAERGRESVLRKYSNSSVAKKFTQTIEQVVLEEGR